MIDLKLADKNDTRNFYIGATIELVSTKNGLRRATRWEILRRRVWRWLTSPIRRRAVVTHIDADNGDITLATDKRWYRFL